MPRKHLPSSAKSRAERPANHAGEGRPTVLSDLEKLPEGSHCLSFYASDEEAAEHAAAFLAGAKDPRSASYWLANDKLVAFTRAKVRQRAPGMEGCVRNLHGPQAVRQSDRFRPNTEVIRFVTAHPDGVTAAGQTITDYWSRETIPGHLEYEHWFEEQPRENSRFLCPYDLRKVPADLAPQVLRDLAGHHSHLVLSKVPDPASLVLQLSVSPDPSHVPKELQEVFEWSLQEGLAALDSRGERVTLALAGEQFAKALRAFPRHP